MPCVEGRRQAPLLEPAMNWYLKKAGSETVYGPVEEKHLEGWAADGRVAPEDLVSADRREWKQAPTIPSLKMEWVAQLPGDKRFGPVPAQAFRELIRSGEMKPDTPVRSTQTGQAMTVASLLAREEKPTESELKWKAEAEAARKAATEAEGRAGQAATALQAVQSQRAQAERERDEARHRAEDAEKRAVELEKKSETATTEARLALEQRAAAQAESASAAERVAIEIRNLQEQLLRARQEKDEAKAAAASEIDKARIRAEQAAAEMAETKAIVQKQAAELRAAAAQLAAARAEGEKWKDQCGRARATAAEAEKARMAALKPPDGLVPRALLDEAQRRIAHLERSYKQALQTVQRSLSARAGESQAMPPDQLRRRDIA